MLQRDEVILGIGDDAAVLDIPADQQLVISTDTLNQAVHFPVDTAPQDIGYKSIAVNLSDMAAMGAEPVAVSLSLSLPEHDAEWLDGFASGFFSLLNEYDVQLIGGDTTRGPLSISLTIYGIVPRGQCIHRSGASAGDAIYITGTLGDAGAALLGLTGELKLTGPQRRSLEERLNRPQPRVAIGNSLRGIASSAIDISDGLCADVGHLLESSRLGASLYVEQLPLSDTYREVFDVAGGWHLPLYAGDDYELCFTIPDAGTQKLKDIIDRTDIPISCIGMIDSTPGLKLIQPDGSTEIVEPTGYDHFRS